MAIKTMNGRTAELIKEACDLKKRMKKDEDRFAEIKMALEAKGLGAEAGLFIGEDDSVLEITSRNVSATIPAAAALQALKDERKGKHFPECVNVVKKRLEMHLDKATVAKLAVAGGKTFAWSFK